MTEKKYKHGKMKNLYNNITMMKQQKIHWSFLLLITAKQKEGKFQIEFATPVNTGLDYNNNYYNIIIIIGNYYCLGNLL